MRKDRSSIAPDVFKKEHLRSNQSIDVEYGNLFDIIARKSIKPERRFDRNKEFSVYLYDHCYKDGVEKKSRSQAERFTNMKGKP